jgi:uncharacterized phage protein (TIGR02218 family)
VRVTIKSWVERLNVKLPRRLFQAACPYTLYDAGCGATRPAATASSLLPGISSDILTVDDASATNTWTKGTVRFTSGVLAGQSRTITASSNVVSVNILLVDPPMRPLPSVGDAVELVLGCDKTLATCGTKFSNAARFGGFPFIPSPESVTP